MFETGNLRTTDSYQPFDLILSNDGFIKFISLELAKTLGYTQSEMFRLDCKRLLAESVDYADLQNIFALKEEKFSRRISLRCKDGTYIGSKAVFVASQQGQERMVSAVIDIDSHVPTETDAPASVNSLFRLMVEAAPDAMIVVTRSGAMTFINAKAEAMFGYPRHEMVGKQVEMLVPPSLRDKHVERRRTYAFDPQEKVMAASRETSGIRRSGEVFPIEVTLTPLKIGSGVLMCASMRDISIRRRTEENFRRLLDAAPDSMLVVSKTRRVLLLNAQSEKLFSYHRSELLGCPSDLLISSDSRPVFASLCEKSLENAQNGNTIVTDKLCGLTKNGKEFPIEASFSPMPVEEGHIVSIAIRDISERKQRESQIQNSLQEKDIFLKEIHHRVKNNLQVMSSLLKLQAHASTNEDVINTFQDSFHRIKSMALVHEQLYQSTGFSDIDFVSYTRKLVDQLCQTFGQLDGRVEIDIDMTHSKIGLDYAIPCGLIINELVSNCLKYAFPNHNSGTISIGLHGDTARDVLTLTVSDDGVGMDSTFSWESSTTLGLKIVQLLTRQLNGQVKCESRQGTTFQIRFKNTISKEELQ